MYVAIPVSLLCLYPAWIVFWAFNYKRGNLKLDRDFWAIILLTGLMFHLCLAFLSIIVLTISFPDDMSNPYTGHTQIWYNGEDIYAAHFDKNGKWINR